MKLAIITDSGANLDATYVAKKPCLRVIPLMIVVGGKSYRDQIEITPAEVYAQIDHEKITTSLPELADVEQLLDILKSEGYTDVLSISISSGLSGTYNALKLFFDQYQGLAITAYDSRTLAGAQGQLVAKAVAFAEQGLASSDIVPLLDKMRHQDSAAYYTINTLKYLKRGGRIGKVEGTIGDILHIKPVITVNDSGVYMTASKSFGFNRALIFIRKELVAKFNDHLINVTIHYGEDKTGAEQLANKLNNELNINELIINPLTPVLGIHTGPQMIAVIASLA